MPTSFDLISALPLDLSFKIFSGYLNLQTLSTASLCCKSWYTIANHDDLWRFICKRHNYGEEFEGLLNEPQLEMATIPAQLNPTFDPSIISNFNRHKKLFAIAQHAEKNWKSGRYAVGPLLKGHSQQVTALGCTGRLVVTGSEDGSMNVYELVTGQLLYSLTNQSGQISQIVVFNANGNPEDDPDDDPFILAGSLDGHIRTFDGTFGMLQTAIQIGKPIVKMVLLKSTVVIATSQGTIEFWDLESQSLIERLSAHQDEVECLVKFGNNLVASGGWDNRLVVVRFNRPNWFGLSTTANQSLRSTRHTENHQAITILFSNQLHNEAVTCCCFIDQRRLVSGSADGTVRFWFINTARCYSVGRGHQSSSEVYCVACCVGSNVAASGASDSAVCVWNLDNGSMLRRLVGDHVGIVRYVTIDAHKLISASDRKRIVIWDYRNGGENGKQLQVLHRQPILVGNFWTSLIRLVVASPEKPGAAVVLSFW